MRFPRTDDESRRAHGVHHDPTEVLALAATVARRRRNVDPPLLSRRDAAVPPWPPPAFDWRFPDAALFLDLDNGVRVKTGCHGLAGQQGPESPRGCGILRLAGRRRVAGQHRSRRRNVPKRTLGRFPIDLDLLRATISVEPLKDIIDPDSGVAMTIDGQFDPIKQLDSSRETSPAPRGLPSPRRPHPQAGRPRAAEYHPRTRTQSTISDNVGPI